VSCSSSCQHHWSWQLFPLVAYFEIILFVEVSTLLPTHPSPILFDAQCVAFNPPYTPNILFQLNVNYIQRTYSPCPPGLHAHMICERFSHLHALGETLTRVSPDTQLHQTSLTTATLSTSNPCSTDFCVHAETRHPPCIPCTQLLSISTPPVRIIIAPTL
jgi:hypothetical protein